MHPHDDSAPLTSDQRLREVAAILAAGILRLHARATPPPDPVQVSAPKDPPESGHVSLEVQEETVLSVHTG
jgi:hypothetical protein